MWQWAPWTFCPFQTAYDPMNWTPEEVRIALSPFILAEQERLYLKQIRRNREYEEKLMKDVPGWKVGHWHEYPVFHNPRGLWVDPNVDEFYAHTTRRFLLANRTQSTPVFYRILHPSYHSLSPPLAMVHA
ncbi:unnamed protein product [Echinostoma caproni]|uniref:NADH dehydrogenase [ubiquinone] 1 alpha subcomplex subunit 13 n=1 Tax=Echinostoma caproni TaxID=27848 RepID=A0A3P8IVS1_9TREM|nr:unnamed protein product [Echinostoma caproni]